MVALFTNIWRTAKTLFLIAEVTPYEQAGTGSSPEKIFLLGDSTGYGTGAGDGKKSIAGLMGAEFPHYAITNNSVNGRTIGEALTALKKLPVEPLHKLILLQIGGNDILQKRPIAQVQTELTALYVEAKARAANVIMISSGNVGTAAAFKGTPDAAVYDTLTRQFRAMFIKTATASEVSYVDLFEEPENDGFAQKPEIYLAIDGLHPSPSGYALWYQSLEPVLRPILQK